MERCSPACTQLLTLDCYNTLKIFQAKNKLFKACEGIPHPPQPAFSKLHLHAIRRFLLAREGANGARSSFACGAASSHHWAPSQLSGSASSKAKQQTRALCQLRNHCPGRTVCPIPQPLVSAAQLPKTCPASTTETAVGQQEPGLKGKREEMSTIYPALSPRKWTGHHWLLSVYNKSTQYRQAPFSKDCYYSMNLKKEKVI